LPCFSLPSVSPSFVHCTLPSLFPTSQGMTAVPPSATSTSWGRTRKYCWRHSDGSERDENGERFQFVSFSSQL
jgi:hypothetical protein